MGGEACYAPGVTSLLIVGYSALVIIILRWGRQTDTGSHESPKSPSLEIIWLAAMGSWSVLVRVLLPLLGPGGAAMADQDLLRVYPLLALSFMVLLRRLAQGAKMVHPAAIPVGCVLVIGSIGDLFDGRVPRSPITLAAVLLPALIGPSQIPDLTHIARAARWSLMAVVSAVALGAVVDTDAYVVPCSEIDPCPVFTSKLAIQEGNANVVSLYLVFLVSVSIIGMDRTRSFALVAITSVMVTLAAGEASLLGLLVVGVYVLNKGAGSLRRNVLLVGLGLASTIATLVPALFRFDDATATYRGLLWNRARQLIPSEVVVGRGSSYWVSQDSFGFGSPNYSAHNLWLEVMVATGIVGVVLLAWAVAASVGSVPRRHRADVWSVVVTVLALSVFESPLQPHRFGISPGIYVFILMFGVVAQKERSRQHHQRLSYTDAQRGSRERHHSAQTDVSQVPLP